MPKNQQSHRVVQFAYARPIEKHQGVREIYVSATVAQCMDDTKPQVNELDKSLEKLISRKYKIPFEAAFWYLMYGFGILEACS